MFSEVRKRAKKAGQAPGTPTYTGPKISVLPVITVNSYTTDNYKEAVGHTLEDCKAALDFPGMLWINVEGLHNVPLIQEITQRFNIHPLTVEDILNVVQRPKLEEFENYIFITLKVLDWRSKSSTFKVKQLSIVFGKNFVLTFQELDTSRFDVIRDKLHSTSNQRLREQGSDYLVYRLIDSIVDEYFVVLESLGDQIEKVEDNIVSNPSPQNPKVVYKLKRQMLLLRKSIWPMREVLNHLLHEDESIISKGTRLYMRDVYDHTVQAIDTVETFRDMLASMLDMYLSSLSNRMNEIMKTLTIITTIFVPITAIASIYGMNFPDLPGLKWHYGFLVAIGAMLTMTTLMIVYFFRKHWV